MGDAAERALAIVGVSAILPDAPDAATFWENVKAARYSIRDVPEELKPRRIEISTSMPKTLVSKAKNVIESGAWMRAPMIF